MKAPTPKRKPYTALQRFLDQRGISVDDIAETIGVTPRTAWNKLAGVSDFYLSEMNTIKDKYSISSAVFFAEY